MLMAPPTKKRKTRQTVKEENVSITAPMIEVSGPDGPLMVFRPWTVTDMETPLGLPLTTIFISINLLSINLND